MLTIDNGVQFLLDRQLITAQSVLEGELRIANEARRNRNLRVTRTDGPGYLIKQPGDTIGGAEHTLRGEAAIYLFCHTEPAVAEAGALLPQLRWYDPDNVLLVLELLENAAPLWSLYQNAGPNALPLEAAAGLGRALGAIHRVFRLPGPLDDPRLAWLRRGPPWIMQVHKPTPDLLNMISPANYETLKIVQTQENIAARLDELLPLWRDETLLHGDIKSDNLLFVARPGDPAPRAYLVDWELAQVGDPAWDVAGLLQDHLMFWVTSMPAAASPDEMAQNARFPLPQLQAAIRRIWKGYVAGAALTPAAAEKLLARAVAYSGARLIQSAYEMAQNADAIPLYTVLALQLASNLLDEPEIAQLQLYGIFQEVAL